MYITYTRYTYISTRQCLKGNVAVYKDLNIEFVAKKSLSRERSVILQLSHIAHVRITHASGKILYVMVIEHVEFRDRLQMLIDCAHEHDGNFHDRWRQNGDALTLAAIQGRLLTRTYAHTIIYSC